MRGPASLCRALRADRRGRYELLDVLGHGQNGVVRLAHDRVRGDYVAVKTLPASRSESSSKLRFLAEQGRHVDHHNVLRTLDWYQQPGDAALAMELADHGSLQDLIDLNDQLPVELVEAIAAQLLDGLEALHGCGLVHRDIKPSNVVLSAGADGELVPKLADLGLAVSPDDLRLTVDPLGCVGTAGFVAPEVMAGRPHSIRSDLWALGRTIHELVAVASPGPSGRLVALVAGLTAHDPADRPHDAAQARRTVGEPTRTMKAWPGVRTDDRARLAMATHRQVRARRRVRVIAAGLAAALVGVTVVRSFSPNPVAVAGEPTSTTSIAGARIDPAPASPNDLETPGLAKDDPCDSFHDAVEQYGRAFERRVDRWSAGEPAAVAFQEGVEDDVLPAIAAMGRFAELTRNDTVLDAWAKTGGVNRNLAIGMLLLSLTAVSSSGFHSTPVSEWLTVRANARVQRDDPSAVGLIAMVVLLMSGTAMGCAAPLPDPVLHESQVDSLGKPRAASTDELFRRIDELRATVPR